MLSMTDEAGEDMKIITANRCKLTPLYKEIKKPEDLDYFVLDRIAHFFNYCGLFQIIGKN